MSSLEFNIGIPSVGMDWNLDPLLFASPDHQSIHDHDLLRYYYISHGESNTLKGHLCCAIVDGIAYSPLNAPYGGYQFSTNISLETMNRFMDFCEEDLKGHVTALIVKSLPEGPVGSSGISNYLMYSRGYILRNSELHGFFKVKGNYALSLNPNYQRRLRLSRTEGFRFHKESADNYEEIYEFLRNCRQERNQELSMSMESLKAHMDKLKGGVKLFSVRNDNELIAASITIRANKKLLYDFAHAHPREYDKFSPVILLMEGINDYASGKGIKYVDLGSSSLGGNPNFPLITFKRNLGAIFYRRSEFEKSLK